MRVWGQTLKVMVWWGKSQEERGLSAAMRFVRPATSARKLFRALPLRYETCVVMASVADGGHSDFAWRPAAMFVRCVPTVLLFLSAHALRGITLHEDRDLTLYSIARRRVRRTSIWMAAHIPFSLVPRNRS